MRAIIRFLVATASAGVFLFLLSNHYDQSASSPSSPPVSDCTVFRTGSAVTATLTGPEPFQSCVDIAHEWSKSSGTIWTVDPSVRDDSYDTNGEPSPVVCELGDPDGAFVFTVRDGGGQWYGGQICEGLVKAGWYPP